MDGHVWIESPIDRVWGLVSSLDRMSSLHSGVVSAAGIDGVRELGLGARFTVLRLDENGAVESATCEVVEFEAPHRIAWTAKTHGRPTEVCRFELAARPGGTWVRQSLQYR